MARKVFFSFHYGRDVRRVAQIRNSWVVRMKGEAQPFCDAADWESVKKRGIQQWIEQQLVGTTVTVVLIGAETYDREWVQYEIKRSHELSKGMLGIFIHNVKDPQLGVDLQGRNPFDYWEVGPEGRKTLFSRIYPTYDWVHDDGYSNLGPWIEAAAKAAGR